MVAVRTPVLFLYASAAAIGLALEVLWLKRLALLFGASLPAVGTGISVFVGCYAAGAAAVAKWGKRDWDVRTRFLTLQVLTGLWCLAVPFLWEGAALVHDAWAAGLGAVGRTAVRILCAAVLLGPTAAALGALYPLFSGAGASRVYLFGTVGSVLGALAASVVPSAVVGFDDAFRGLGAGSLLLAALSVRARDVPAFVAEARSHVHRASVVVAFLLGVSLFAVQVVWFRLVWLIVDQTTYTEGVVVAVVMVGLATGALLARRWSPPFGWTLVALGGAQLLPGFLMGALHDGWNAVVSGSSLSAFLALEALLVFAIVGLPCVAYGIAIPSLCRGLTNSAVGRIWCGHNIGCVLGGLLASFLLVPTIGVHATLVAATAVILAALWLRRARWGAGVVGALCLLTAVAGDVTFRGRAMADVDLLFHHEDGAGVTEVIEDRGNGARQLLSSRRRQEGGSDPDQVALERLQGELPLAVHGRHQELLVVGLGTGITLGASMPETVDRAVCVEISPGVIEASRWFEHENRAVLEDPRLTLVCDDGRSFVRLTDRRFDLVVQELFFPYRTGVGALYTLEHFRRCRALLRKGGRMAQWISLAQIGPAEMRSLVRTFGEVYPNVSLWLAGGYMMILGGDEPYDENPGPYLRHFVVRGEAVRAWARNGILNTEDNMHIQSTVPKSFDLLNSTDLTLMNLRELLAMQQDATELRPDLPVAPTRAARLLHEGILLRAEKGDEAALPLYEAAYELDPDNPLVSRFLAERHARKRNFEAAARIDPTLLTARFNRGVQLYRKGRFSEAIVQFRAVTDAQPRAPDALFNLANSLAQMGRY
ncbi:MAG: tetratricopeptide repeat protein, partial [Planctomycetota bacterium]